jgi:hypothetical protein
MRRIDCIYKLELQEPENDFEKVDILYGDNPYSYYNPFYKPSEEVRNGLYY